jgi:3-isopropylmalate dehydrogenase
MLRHGLGMTEDADRVEAAVEATLTRGLRTPDLAANEARPKSAELPLEIEVGTQEMTTAVIEALG